MSYPYLILLSVYAVCFAACKDISTPAEHADIEIQLRQSDTTLVIYLDSLSDFRLEGVQYLDPNDQIAFTNPISNCIDIYNLTDGNIEKRIFIPRHGPGSLSQLQGFHYINSDSIYAFGKFHLWFTRIYSAAGEVVDNQPLHADWENYSRRPINHLSNNLSASIVRDSAIYLTCYPLFDMHLPNNIDQGYSFEVVYDFKEDNIRYLPIHFPEFQQGKIWSSFTLLPTRAINDRGEIIYSWPLEEDLLIYTPTGQVTRSYAHHSALGKRMPAFGTSPNPYDEIRYSLTHYHHRRILFDPYHQKYYRIALLPTQYDKYAHQDYQAFDAQQIVVIVLDRNFKRETVVKLEKDRYNYYDCFVGPLGLYFPHTNYYNPNLNEDTLRISTFKF